MTSVKVLAGVGICLLLVPGVLAVTYPDYQGGGFEFAIGFTAFIYGVSAVAGAFLAYDFQKTHR